MADLIFINGIKNGSQIKLYNLNGDDVLDQTNTTYLPLNKASLDLRNLASGVYFIYVRNNVYKIYKY